MIVLKANEICPHAKTCPLQDSIFICRGADKDRDTEFFCQHINSDGTIKNSMKETIKRVIYDKTGRMEFLQE